MKDYRKANRVGLISDLIDEIGRLTAENKKLKDENAKLKKEAEGAWIYAGAVVTIAEDLEEDIKRLEALLIEDLDDYDEDEEDYEF